MDMVIRIALPEWTKLILVRSRDETKRTDMAQLINEGLLRERGHPESKGISCALLAYGG